VGVKWKGQYLILTAGHVVDYCPKTRCGSFAGAGHPVCAAGARVHALSLEFRGLVELRHPRPRCSPMIRLISRRSFCLPSRAPRSASRHSIQGRRCRGMARRSVFSVIPAQVKSRSGRITWASPEHFFGALDAAGAACRHEPQEDFTIPYELPHRANGIAEAASGISRRSRSGRRNRTCAASWLLNARPTKSYQDTAFEQSQNSCKTTKRCLVSNRLPALPCQLNKCDFRRWAGRRGDVRICKFTAARCAGFARSWRRHHTRVIRSTT